VLTGHDHIYERMKPQQGIQYFVTGSGGALRPGDFLAARPSRPRLSRTGQIVDSGLMARRAIS
jgi:hypothetical protein